MTDCSLPPSRTPSCSPASPHKSASSSQPGLFLDHFPARGLGLFAIPGARRGWQGICKVNGQASSCPLCLLSASGSACRCFSPIGRTKRERGMNGASFPQPPPCPPRGRKRRWEGGPRGQSRLSGPWQRPGKEWRGRAPRAVSLSEPLPLGAADKDSGRLPRPGAPIARILKWYGAVVSASASGASLPESQSNSAPSCVTLSRPLGLSEPVCFCSEWSEQSRCSLSEWVCTPQKSLVDTVKSLTIGNCRR